MCLSVMPLTGLEQCTRRDSKFKFWVDTWCKLCQTGRNHIFGMHVFVLYCPGGAVWGWAFDWVMVPDSVGIYVGSVG